MTSSLDMRLRADLGEVARMLDAVEAFGAQHRLPADKLYHLSLMLDELVTNIVSHGFAEDSDEPRREPAIDLRVASENGGVTAELVDNGPAFNPLEAEPVDLGEGLEGRRIGGLGLRFVRNYANRLEYRREQGRNHLRLGMDLAAAR